MTVMARTMILPAALRYLGERHCRQARERAGLPI
jgi:hypothetical protein